MPVINLQNNFYQGIYRIPIEEAMKILVNKAGKQQKQIRSSETIEIVNDKSVLRFGSVFVPAQMGLILDFHK